MRVPRLGVRCDALTGLLTGSPDHMKTLYDVCVSPKVWRTFSNGSHNDTYAEEGYFESILEFITAVVRGSPLPNSTATTVTTTVTASGQTQTTGSPTRHTSTPL